MARTFDEHKADVLAEFPVPAVTWELHDPDVENDHFENVAALAKVSYKGKEYVYEISVRESHDQVEYTAHYVKGTDAPRVRQFTNSEWPRVREMVNTNLGHYTDGAVDEETIERLAHDVMDDDGLSYPSAVHLTALRMSSSPQQNMVYTPTFSSEVLEYAIQTSITPVTLTAIVPEGATVAWKYGLHTGVEEVFTAATVTGVNVVTCTVSLANYAPTTYTITITKP